ncbi:hypothetical protein SCHPADRAFT_941841 [Schizopora paradoxa]|uniref:Uncharacterized protein n=1 Tax=Schizopora paradoxa TaxID=27342 RepID=A0A0H2RQE7_9AGAM|nr:hypothetical protein SCHPADRAFT_941841 [Schizopora paradoxa]
MSWEAKEAGLLWKTLNRKSSSSDVRGFQEDEVKADHGKNTLEIGEINESDSKEPHEPSISNIDEEKECESGRERARARAMEVAEVGRYIDPDFAITETYSDVCRAVAEFELGASTLRTDSTALSLCKKLVTRSAPDLFKALEDFRPRPRPDVPLSVKSRMQEWAQTREPVWQRREDAAFILNAERMRRFVSRRARLRDLTREWAKERAQALNDVSASGNENMESQEARVHGWERAKHQARLATSFELQWLEMKEKGDKDVVEMERMEYEFFLSAWNRDWARAWFLQANIGEQAVLETSAPVLKYSFERSEALHWDKEQARDRAEELGRSDAAFRSAGEDEVYTDVWLPGMTAKQGVRVAKGMASECLRDKARFQVEAQERKLLRYLKSEETLFQTLAKRQDHFYEVGSSVEWPGRIGWWEKHFKSRLWDGGFLVQLSEVRRWIREDQSENPSDWNASSRRLFEFWREDVKDWEERVDLRMLLVDEFEKTSISLLEELAKIDGSGSASEFNVFNSSNFAYEVGRQHHLADQIASMKVAMGRGNEARFSRGYKSALDVVQKALRSNELKQGLEALIKKQEHSRNSFMDFATVAIFFSSITATTIQFSFQSGDHSVPSIIVNICWFASLVLSISSATNSLLGVLVHQSPEYLRPSRSRDYHFLQGWFRFVPPTLLSMSGALFLMGLCGFTFLSTSTFTSQGKAVQIVTTALTSTNFFFLLIIFLMAFTKFLRPIISLLTQLVGLILLLTLGTIILLLYLIAMPFSLFYHFVRFRSLPQRFDDLFPFCEYLVPPLMNLLTFLTPINDYKSTGRSLWRR